MAGASSSGGLGRGAVWNLGSAIVPLAGSFVVSLLIAPYLGPEGFGAYMTAMSAATLALIVAKFGVHAATSRLLTENPEDGGTWLRAGMLLRTLFTIPVAILFGLFAQALATRFGGDELTTHFRIIPLVIIAASAYELLSEALVGLRRFRSLFALRLGSLLLRLGAVAWVRLAVLGSSAFLFGHALSQAIPGLLLAALLLSLPRRSNANLGAAVRHSYRIALPLAFGSASFLIYAHTDRLMLAWFHDAATVGQFGVARNVLDAALFPIFALSFSLRPALVRAYADQELSARREILADGLRYSFLFASAGAAVVLSFGPALLLAFYKSDYAVAADLLRWMVPILMLRGLGTPIFAGLLAADRQEDYARLMVATAVINVVANFFLIPSFGAIGAVWGTIISLLPLSIVGLRILGQSCGSLPWRHHLRHHLAALIASGAILGFSQLWRMGGDSLVWLLGGATLASALAASPLLLGRTQPPKATPPTA